MTDEDFFWECFCMLTKYQEFCCVIIDDVIYDFDLNFDDRYETIFDRYFSQYQAVWWGSPYKLENRLARQNAFLLMYEMALTGDL